MMLNLKFKWSIVLVDVFVFIGVGEDGSKVENEFKIYSLK